MVGFGLSRQFWSVVLARCAEGALCGNIGVAKGMVAELTDASNMAQAFAFLPIIWTIGSTIGPLIGGLLARPATRWPNTFDKHTFFRLYPYFLPCITAASVSISAFILALFLMKETLPSDLRRRKKSKASDQEKVQNLTEHPTPSFDPCHIHSHLNIEPQINQSSNEPDETAAAHAAPVNSKRPTLRSLLVRRVVVSIINYAFLAFIDQCLVVLQPLMYSSSIPLGGLGFSSFTIGIAMGVWGTINGVFSIFAFTKILDKFGVRRLYIVSFASYLVCFGAFPVMSSLAKRSGVVGGIVWVILVLQLTFYVLAYMGFACILLYINDGAPRSALGAVNGLAQMIASIMRALAPSTASSLFSVSLLTQQHDVVLRGNMVYLVLCAITLVGVTASFQLPCRLLSQEAR